MMLTLGLEEQGHEVVQAEDGQAALDLLEQEPFDLVITDIEMPRLDGHALLDRRRAAVRWSDTPFIVVSGVDEMESVVRCIQRGAEDYLPKPFDPVLLAARVGASLEKKRLRDSEHALLETVSRMAKELREWNQQLEARVEEKVREVDRLGKLQRFVAPQLADILMSDRDGVLESHRREIAVLFCDLRGFTPFSETAEPEDVMAVLRELHEGVVPLVFAHEGTLAQFTGDGMMIIFNDPIPCTDPAVRAVDLGVAMIERARELAEVWRKRGHVLEMGAGVAFGYATCGRIGFEGRFEYTAIGPVVNLAARLCGEARGGQLLVNERVRGVIEATHRIEDAGELSLKGIGRPLRGYVVTGTFTGEEP
ncbi:MAG: adenylate/guanylate cyclase domain-containing response regulator [Chloroflexi bacterium]|nr:adenylate/guanylate cyclase domain-containing response regulator [Chloroflexota bacterium]